MKSIFTFFITLLLFVIPNLASATDYFVTNTNDSGSGSLRLAVFVANGNLGADHIKFSIPAGSTINLLSHIRITEAVTISGPVSDDKGSIILDAGNTNRHFEIILGFVSPDVVTLENMTLTNGNITSPNGSYAEKSGGAILITNGKLVLNHTLITNNSVMGGGGGIFSNDAHIELNHTVIINNLAENYEGGGIRVSGSGTPLTITVVINNSTISGNTVSASNGGGIEVFQAELTISNSTISDNKASGNGGGIYYRGNAQITSNITKTTVSGNYASSEGGGIWVSMGVTLILTQSTVSNNYAYVDAGGIFVGNHLVLNETTVTKNRSTAGIGEGIAMSLNFSSFTMNNSILSGNPDIFSTYNFHDSSTSTPPTDSFNVYYSLYGDPISEITGDSATALEDNNPKLGPLQYNGGKNKTHKPKFDSNVLNTASNTLGIVYEYDQRQTGFPRIVSAQKDMGAVELQQVFVNNVIVPLNPHEILTRRDMAREVLKAIEGENYVPLDPNNNDLPYQVQGTYTDVGITDINAVFIEELQRRGFTEGCAVGKFCPNMAVTKEQMAKVFVGAKNLTQPPSSNTFYDVQGSSTGPFGTIPGAFAWVEITKMRDQGYSIGCNTILVNQPFPQQPIVETLFCPKEPVTREWFNSLLGQLP